MSQMPQKPTVNAALKVIQECAGLVADKKSDAIDPEKSYSNNDLANEIDAFGSILRQALIARGYTGLPSGALAVSADQTPRDTAQWVDSHCNFDGPKPEYVRFDTETRLALHRCRNCGKVDLTQKLQAIGLTTNTDFKDADLWLAGWFRGLGFDVVHSYPVGAVSAVGKDGTVLQLAQKLQDELVY
jgi:hypothetical protein